MPLTDKGEKIKEHMEAEYGEKKGESVFYASRNAGTINGVDAPASAPPPGLPTSKAIKIGVGADGRYVIG